MEDGEIIIMQNRSIGAYKKFRREHKEMDYAFEPTGKDDDYDVRDLTGKDYFDIE